MKGTPKVLILGNSTTEHNPFLDHKCLLKEEWACQFYAAFKKYAVIYSME